MSNTVEKGFSLHYQLQICSLLVRDPNFLIVNHNLIKPSYFDNYHVKNIVRKIYEYFKEYRKSPTKTALTTMINDLVSRERLDSEITYVYHTRIDTIYSQEIEDPEYIKNTVILYCKKKEYIQFIDWCYRHLNEYNRDFSDKTMREADEELIQDIDSKFLDLMSKGYSRDLGMVLTDSLSDLDSIVNEESSVVRTKTGFPTLTQVMGGGYRNGGLYVWVAPPGVGKTTVLISEACAILRQGKCVVYYTFEMTEKEILLRIVSNLFGMSEQDMTDPERLKNAIEEFEDRYSANLIIKHYNEYEATCNTLMSNTKQFELLHGVKVEALIVDYADYVQPIKGLKDSMYQDKGNAYKDLKKTAVVLDIPVISASQTKNEGFKVEIIDMHHLEGSSMKAHIVDGLFTCNLQSRNDILDKDKPPRVLIYIAKLRKRVGFGIDSIMSRFNYPISMCYEDVNRQD